jgi:hypothetical protein
MDEKVKVNFNAHVMTGAVGVKAVLCRRPRDMANLTSECNITKEEMLEPQPDEEVMQHQGSYSETPDYNICFPNGLLLAESGAGDIRQNNTAQCIYVIGVIGMSNYTSHYTIMVEVSDQAG